MDLGTVSNKLRENRYENVEEVFDDLQLIWDNCKMYNPSTSVFLGVMLVDSYGGVEIGEIV